MSKQIKDFINISETLTSDYFICQRVDGYTNETFKISSDNLLKKCIKWGDPDIITSFDWMKLTHRPVLSINLSGMASGQGSIDLSLNQLSFNVNVIDLDLSSVTLGYTPVQQGGGLNQNNDKISIGWNTNSTRLKATVANTKDLGNFVFDSDLVWGSVLNKPSIHIILDGKISGEGLVNLGSTLSQTLTITSIDFSTISWNTIQNKPTLKFNINGLTAVDIGLGNFFDNAQIPVKFDLSTIKLNTLKLGPKTNSKVQLMLCSSDYPGDNEADFVISREVNKLGKATIYNTIFCNNTYSNTSWNTWNPLTDWTTNFSYLNRVEVLPLLYTPNLIAEKANISTLVVQRLEFNGTSKLLVNGVEIDLTALIALVSA